MLDEINQQRRKNVRELEGEHVVLVGCHPKQYSQESGHVHRTDVDRCNKNLGYQFHTVAARVQWDLQWCESFIPRAENYQVSPYIVDIDHLGRIGCCGSRERNQRGIVHIGLLLSCLHSSVQKKRTVRETRLQTIACRAFAAFPIATIRTVVTQGSARPTLTQVDANQWMRATITFSAFLARGAGIIRWATARLHGQGGIGIAITSSNVQSDASKTRERLERSSEFHCLPSAYTALRRPPMGLIFTRNVSKSERAMRMFSRSM